MKLRDVQGLAPDRTARKWPRQDLNPSQPDFRSQYSYSLCFTALPSAVSLTYHLHHLPCSQWPRQLDQMSHLCCCSASVPVNSHGRNQTVLLSFPLSFPNDMRIPRFNTAAVVTSGGLEGHTPTISHSGSSGSCLEPWKGSRRGAGSLGQVTVCPLGS